MKPIAVFFHCLFTLDGTPLPAASAIVAEQMEMLSRYKLLDACREMNVGVNGGSESYGHVAAQIPFKAKVRYHGLSCHAENPTIVWLQNWAKDHPGWNILYFHSKGATHATDSDYAMKVATPWRWAMMEDLVKNWPQCVADLEFFDIVCSRWLWNMADGSQHVPAGNFLWITSDFAAKLPSMFDRERIKQDGIGAVTSRYEAEVHWGNGPKPNVKSIRPNGGGGIP